MTVAILQRYALFLAGFGYSIEYNNNTLHRNAGGLSASFRTSMRQGDSCPSGDFSSVTDASAAGKCRYDSANHPERSFIVKCDETDQARLASSPREGAGTILQEED